MSGPITRLIALDRIDVGERLRSVNTQRAGEIAVSMAEVGQLTPIEVMPILGDEGRYSLVSGAHRLAAARINGAAEIWASLFLGEATEARMREIDENLFRRELSPYDQAAFLTERRSLYEAIHGPIKAGKKKSGKVYPNSFAADVAEKFGLSREMVKLALRRRKSIGDAAWYALRGTDLAENGSVLDALTKVPAEKQSVVVTTMVGRGAKTVAAALEALDGSPAQADPGERAYGRFLALWAGMDAATKARVSAFVKTQVPKKGATA